LNTSSNIAAKLSDPEYRKAFVSSQIKIGIAFQIRALLNARGWTQKDLAERSGMLQPRISGMMTPGKTRPNIETLRRLAEAFDCGLMVRFAPFSEMATWSDEFDPDCFNVPSFEEDTLMDSSAGVVRLVSDRLELRSSPTSTLEKGGLGSFPTATLEKGGPGSFAGNRLAAFLNHYDRSSHLSTLSPGLTIEPGIASIGNATVASLPHPPPGVGLQVGPRLVVNNNKNSLKSKGTHFRGERRKRRGNRAA
jgi:transcriptional regulator with XRE-family HTH domain